MIFLYISGLQTLPEKGKSMLIFHLIIHYTLFLCLTIFGHPEEEVSIGLHERVGPCNENVPIQTAFGTVSIESMITRNI